jgi:hypothetical protein
MQSQHSVGIMMAPFGDTLQAGFRSCDDKETFGALDAGALW